MDSITNKCYNEDHPNTEAVYYCIECKISMCQDCELLHSKLFKKHNRIALDKNKNTSEIFTGFCKEKNHFDKLDFFCKTHNKLCCSGCISKIKLKDKGQHSDCEICSLDDIKESKEKILKENILNLEKLNKEVDALINEIKIVFQNMDKNKKELQINIQKIFIKIRKAVNERENEILLKVDELFSNNSNKEKEMNEEYDKFINKIKDLLKQSKNGIENLNRNKDYNKLSSFINDCINIEKSLLNIKNKDNLINLKKEISSNIKFSPCEGDELNQIISNLNKFGNILKGKEIIQIPPKKNEDNLIELEIKSTNEELNGLSINFFTFKSEDYNKFYPSDFIIPKNCAGIFTIHLDLKNEFMNKFFENEKRNVSSFKDIFKDEDPNLSLRRKGNKLYIDSLNLMNQKDVDDYLFELISNQIQILVNFQNKLTFENFKNMNYEEFFNLVASFNLKLKGNLGNLESQLKTFIQEKKDIIKNESDNIDFLDFVRLLSSNKAKIKWDISLDKLNDSLKFIFLRENKDSPNKINEAYKSIKEKIEGNIKKFFHILETTFSCKLSEDIIYDKILFTLLVAEYKSGVALEINPKGIKDYLKAILE